MIDKKLIPNTIVTRWYKWGFYGTEKTETVSTDMNWYFSFPIVKIKSVLIWIIPHEPIITQRLFVHYNNENIQIYGTVKHGYAMNDEFWGKTLEFVFDPTQDIQIKTFSPFSEMSDFTESISIRPPK